MFAKIVVVSLCIVAVSFVRTTDSLKIPSYFKTCSRNDPNVNQCIIKNGQLALPSLIKGDRKYRIPELNPLVLTELKIAQGENLKINLYNAKITGFKDTIIENANYNFKTKKISMDFRFPKLIIDANYEINGRVLVLPITGKGPFHLDLDDVTVTYTFTYDVVKKGNDEFMKPKRGKITYDTQFLKLRLDNLFNGDKVLGPETNNFLNENWREVHRELGPGVAEALAEVVFLIINNVSELVPYAELFPEK